MEYKFDFTSIIDRVGHDAMAVEGLGLSPGFAPDAPKEGFSPIPMWVADMNFATAPSIPEAIIERVRHPLYGYFRTTDEYYQAIIDWHRDRKGVTDLEKKHIGYENGVLGGVVSAANVLASRGDNILVHSPTYIGFTMCLENNGYNLVHSPLVKDEQGVWRMDFEDMERRIAENHIHLAIFCSPHNPCGRVWERWEIEKAMELYRKYDVYVISDEIWSDLIMPGYTHIPTQSVSEDAKMRTVALYAPSKTFNLAGLIGSYHVIYNDWLRDRVDKESSLAHYNDINVLSQHALIGAYSETGRAWLDELLTVLDGNIRYACEQLTTRFPGVKISRPQGTYMLYVDLTDWCAAHGKTLDEVLKAGWDAGVAWQDGRMFHGPCHIRLNLALPFSLVEEAVERMDKYVFNAE